MGLNFRMKTTEKLWKGEGKYLEIENSYVVDLRSLCGPTLDEIMRS